MIKFFFLYRFFPREPLVVAFAVDAQADSGPPHLLSDSVATDAVFTEPLDKGALPGSRIPEEKCPQSPRNNLSASRTLKPNAAKLFKLNKTDTIPMVDLLKTILHIYK